MTVVDASVAVKWFFPERSSFEAQALLESGEELTAPPWSEARFLRLSREKYACARFYRTRPAPCVLCGPALVVAARWLSSRTTKFLSAAVDLALASSHPLQDCLYLALAQREQALLVTADPKFRLRAQPLYPSLQLLAD